MQSAGEALSRERRPAAATDSGRKKVGPTKKTPAFREGLLSREGGSEVRRCCAEKVRPDVEQSEEAGGLIVID